MQVLNWTAQDSAGYFTDGNAGLRALAEATGWKIIAHNRYWSPYTNYAKANGGVWDFFVDAPGTGAGMAVPLDQAFWVWLLQSSVSEWGLTTYEQDWLHNEVRSGVAAPLNREDLRATLSMHRFYVSARRCYRAAHKRDPRSHLDAADGLRG